MSLTEPRRVPLTLLASAARGKGGGGKDQQQPRGGVLMGFECELARAAQRARCVCA